MSNYVFTNSMKRYERSDLCVKLYKEMVDNGRLQRIFNPLIKHINKKNKSKNIFKPSKQPIYAIEAATYKGLSFYLIVDQFYAYDVVFNTSPVDAAYVEFTRVIASVSTSTMVYTQHALDRYNERIHSNTFTNHKDIIKRLIVNNPPKVDAIYDEPTRKIVHKINEGFLYGKFDAIHRCIIINTFYDSNEYTDNVNEAKARKEFNKIADFTPKQLAKYHHLSNQLHSGLISKDEYDYQLYINGFDIK